jgi:hypothetical protein
LLLALGLFLSGCSSEDDEGEVKEHVWKDQVEAIDKAREVENVLKDAAGKQKKAAQDSGY